MDSEEDSSDTPPATHIRWFHAGHGVGHLDLLATPILSKLKPTSATNTSWTPFTRDESDCCEAAWHALDDEQRVKALAGDPGIPPAVPLINVDEVKQSESEYLHLSLLTTCIHPTNRNSSYSVSPSVKSAFLRSTSERCAYVASPYL